MELIEPTNKAFLNILNKLKRQTTNERIVDTVKGTVNIFLPKDDNFSNIF